MNFKVVFEIDGKAYPSYFQTEENAYEEIVRKSKYGWTVVEIVRFNAN